MLSDLPLAELREYAPAVAEPADFAEFWAEQVAAALGPCGRRPPSSRSAGLCGTRRSTTSRSPVITATRSRAGCWCLLQRLHSPVIVEYIGYGGGRGEPFDWLNWSCAGYPHLVVDSRGQGGRWRSADTPDLGDRGAPSTPGFMTRGIASPQTHYYTRLFTDAALAVDAVGDFTPLAGRPVVTTGGSQGGGLAIAAAHLSGRVAATMPTLLSLPTRAGPSTSPTPTRTPRSPPTAGSGLAEVDQVFATLSYLDVVNHAKRVSAPALLSVGLTDVITPPSTIFTAYNHYAGPKDIAVYQFSGHEGGGTAHFLAQLAFLREHGLG